VGDGVLQAIEATKHARTLAPADAEALADAVRSLGAEGLAAVVRGAGTELPQGNLPRRVDVLLSTTALRGVDVLDADEGVTHVAAGTPVATLREAARREGLDVPLDPPSPASTVGGTLAAAALGPRTLGFGRVRDQVLGLEVVLGSGERTRCGGRVVKNVTGYDLAKLYVGSLGSLCVITHAWLRLRPLPEEVRTLAAVLPAGAPSFAAALAAARLSGVRAAALVDGALAGELGSALPQAPRDGFVLALELASDATVVSQTAELLASRHGATPLAADAFEAVAALEGAADEARFASALRVRVTARVARLAAVHAALHAAGAALVVHPGLGLLCARFPLEAGSALPSSRVDAVLSAAREAARAGEGSAVLAAAPAFVRDGRDVFGEPPVSLALMRRLKAQFDPKGVLNPGCFVGGI
jgi:glycolate oxidase FAD binding subunit